MFQICDTMYSSLKWGRLAQLVEHQSYKLGVTGSSPVSPTIKLSNFDICSLVAQLVERTTVNR